MTKIVKSEISHIRYRSERMSNYVWYEAVDPVWETLHPWVDKLFGKTLIKAGQAEGWCNADGRHASWMPTDTDLYTGLVSRTREGKKIAVNLAQVRIYARGHKNEVETLYFNSDAEMFAWIEDLEKAVGKTFINLSKEELCQK